MIISTIPFLTKFFEAGKKYINADKYLFKLRMHVCILNSALKFFGTFLNLDDELLSGKKRSYVDLS